MTNEPATGRWLDAQEVARVLGISPRTVRRLATSRQLAHHRIGGQIRVARVDLEAYVAASRVEAADSTKTN